MPKTYKHLYYKIYNPLNLWQAYKQAAKAKRYKAPVAAFEYDLEKHLLDIEYALKDESYQPGGYHSFIIQKPKRRLINAAPFCDRVVHHALMNIIEPLFERQFIFDSYANRIGKGTHKALDRTTYYLRRNKYVMHLDIRQFFPAIDHEILLSILSRTVKDKKVMNLVMKIISNGAGAQTSVYDQVFFSGDTLFSANRPRGLPIGNLTSQNWANVYLNELDQYVKRELKCCAYLRYVDDFLLFANDKKKLRVWRREIISFLGKLRLTIHENKAHSRPCHTGVSFLGFQVFPKYRRLKPANGYAYQRRLKKMVELLRTEEITEKNFQMCLQSWINHAGYGDTFGLRKALLFQAGIYADLTGF